MCVHVSCTFPQRTRLPCASSLSVGHAVEEDIAHFAMSEGSALSYASTGCVTCARKATTVNFSTSMTWARCQSATSIRSLASAITKIASTYMWRQIPSRSVTVLGTIVDSANMVIFSMKETANFWQNLSIFIILCYNIIGPNCRNKHTRRVLCQNYLCGFCPNGPKCKFIQ